ncbi:MAG TPA: carboxypeptidase-like regulatory domain-containing protein [Terriglobia bacterium]|nr:carboxypeptidase-like regulatory domain-containing protein [Terriglobia bacterium]
MARYRMFSLLASAILFAAAAFGQATSSLRGTVTDAQGGVIGGAVVQLVSQQTSFRRSIATDEGGSYQFAQVPPGMYVLVVEMQGFAVATHTGLELLVNTPATLNVKMAVATVAETVNVEADAGTINTVDATIGHAFNELQVRQLPLQTRNVVELLSLQPGVTPTGEVVGARRDQNNVTLDGVDVNDNQTAGVENSQGAAPIPGYNFQPSGNFRESGFNAALPVPLDSVQEFRVTVGGQNANQGRSSGGQVTLVTRSGGNQYHGSAYEFHRNTVTSANNWFNNRAGVPREQLIRNQFGASLGGRIVKDRVFFFANFEQRLDSSAASQLRKVPADSMKQGLIRLTTNDGATRTLSLADIKEIDPLHIGVSPAMLDIFRQMPAANDAASGLDRGLNFSGFRFNAPLKLDNKAYVAKLDFKLDSMGFHTVSVRGTLADNAQDETLAQYPGQAAATRLINNSRGGAAVYTAVLNPSLVNTFTFGLTRIGLERTGAQGTAFTFDTVDSLTNYARGYVRVAPTYNFANDMTWTRQKHTLTLGANLRLVRNNRTSYLNAFPRYSFSRGNLVGLGADIVTATEDFLARTTGTAGIRLSDPASVSRAFGDLFGVITTGTMIYNYTRDGTALPIGAAPLRKFASNEIEFYLGDSWRTTPSLTVTYGVRYSNYGVPYEQNGLQVGPVFPLQSFYAERLGGMMAGIPSNALPHALMQYDFNGPGNNKPSWYKRDNNNFAPRVSFAYSPGDSGGIASRLLGKSGVVRAGAGILFDRYGSDLVTQFDNTASFGLSEINNMASVNFTTGSRYLGGLPVPPAATQHTFPFTPGEVNFIGGNYMGISTDLHTPYSMVFNMSVAREIPGGLTVEASYAGRLSRGLLMQIDAGGWALQFKDPKSGITWKEMAKLMRGYHDAGIDPRAVATNPGLIPLNPFVENLFPALTNNYFAGSATANYYNLLWGQQAGSDADTVHQLDRVRSAKFPNCIVATGCYTFYPIQSSGMSMWTNTGFASFNGGTISIRKPFSRGLSFDFNYTLSHSIDNGGGPEAGGGSAGGIMLNPFDYRAFRGSSDFDIRHNLNSNVLYELPFGQGKPLLSNATGWLDQIAGGWQVSGIMRYRSGLPTAVAYSGLWPTNFSYTTLAYAVAPYDAKVGFNEFGNPSIFSTVKEAANWKPMLPGEVGTRAAVRLDGFVNTDIAVSKIFRMPVEGHRLQFRAEAFNAFNNVNFTNLTLDANSPSNFGQFTAATPARVMQFALRYEF